MKKLKVSSSDDDASVKEPVDQGIGDSSSLQTLQNSKIEMVIDDIQPLPISLRRLPASWKDIFIWTILQIPEIEILEIYIIYNGISTNLMHTL